MDDATANTSKRKDPPPASAAPAATAADGDLKQGHPTLGSPNHRPSLNDFNVDNIILHILHFLNVIDSDRLSGTSKRFLFLVHQFRTTVRGPEVVSVSSWKGEAGNNEEADDDDDDEGCDKDDDDDSDASCDSSVQRRRELDRAIKRANLSQKQLVRRTIHGLNSRPNLILSFIKGKGVDGYWYDTSGRFPGHQQPKFPRETVHLGATAPFIQVNHPNNTSSSSSSDPSGVDVQSLESLMACHFPGVTILPFHMDDPGGPDDIKYLKRRMKRISDTEAAALAATDGKGGTKAATSYWKAMIVYACGGIGTSWLNHFLATMQSLVPTIVGGVCNGGYVSPVKYRVDDLQNMTFRWLGRQAMVHFADQEFVINARKKATLIDQIMSNPVGVVNVYDGIFGVVLGGEVPIRAVVSNGVKSVVEPNTSPPGRFNLAIHRADILRPWESGFMFESDHAHSLKPVQMIHELKDTVTGRVFSYDQAMETLFGSEHRSEYIGLRLPRFTAGSSKISSSSTSSRANSNNDQVYELFTLNSDYCDSHGCFLVRTDGSAHEVQDLDEDVTQVDFFGIDCDECLQDMDRMVAKLQEEIQGEEILGAIMFSSRVRGPDAEEFISEPMADATRFHNGFPNVSCLGLYTKGVIGPPALSRNDGICPSGRAKWQELAVVFAMFVVPKKEMKNYNVNDSSVHVEEFMKNSRIFNPIKEPETQQKEKASPKKKRKVGEKKT